MIRILKAISFVLSKLPAFVYMPVSAVIGSLAYAIDSKHRRTALENLERAFGNSLSRREKEAIAKNVFINLVRLFFEFMRIPWLKKEDLKGLVRCEGMENLERALSKKKGVILLTAHFGNWELMAAWYALMGYPIDVVVRDLDNPSIDGFVRWARSRPGNTIISKRKAMIRLMRGLSEGRIAGILLDQNVADVEGVFVDFFGTPACTNKGPAMLAAASGAPVVPTFIMREKGFHRLVIGEEIPIENTGDRNRDAATNTARCTKAIEEMIRKHPDQWFWVHRRWKTRPKTLLSF